MREPRKGEAPETAAASLGYPGMDKKLERELNLLIALATVGQSQHSSPFQLSARMAFNQPKTTAV